MKNEWILKVLVAACFLTSGSFAVADYSKAIDNPLVQSKIGYIEDVSSISYPITKNARSLSGAIQTEIIVEALGQNFHLILEENDAFNKNIKINWIGDSQSNSSSSYSTFYKGTVKDIKDSWVRIEINGEKISGTIHTPYDVYVIEPKSRFTEKTANNFNSQESNKSVIYRLSDVGTGLPVNFCGVETDDLEKAELLSVIDDPEQTKKEYRILVDDIKTMASYSGGTSTEMKELKIGLVADYEFYQKYGAESATKLESIANQIDGIYRNDLKIALNVTSITVYTSDSSDPFSGTTDSYALLREAGTYFTNDSSFSQNGVNHLISGKNFDGSIIGLAYVDTVCSNSRYSTSITQSYESFLMSQVLVSAHEIGHNLGATHDSSADGRYIMWPSASSSVTMNFSDRTQDQIVSNKSMSCFSSTADTSVTLIDEPMNNDNTISISALIQNTSTITASSIILAIDLPSSISYIETETIDTTCAHTLGQILCEVDSLEANEEVEIAFIVKLNSSAFTSLTTDNIGVDQYASITATIESDSIDSFPANNSDTIDIEIPATGPQSNSDSNTASNESEGSGGGGGSMEALAVIFFLFLVMISYRNQKPKGVKIPVRKTNQTNLKK